MDIFYDFQGQRVQTQLRIGASTRNHVLTAEELSVFGIKNIMDSMKKQEYTIQVVIRNQLKNHAIYTQYLSKIKGIGELIAAGLISYIDDIKKFDHISSLWQYCGYGMNRFCPACKKPTYVNVEYETGKIAKKLHPKEVCPLCEGITKPVLQKRTTGYQSNWNDKLKELGWKASSSFVKQSAEKSGYRRLYDQIKKEEKKNNPEKMKIDGITMFNDGHIHNRAMRKVTKIFLAHLWQTWRKQQDLEVTEPYVKELLGHSTVEAFIDK